MPYADIDSGLLHLDAEITYDNTVVFLTALHQMEANPKIGTITIYITSYGGMLMPSVAIVQAMKTCTKQIRTLGAGYIASAALPILAAGSKGHRSIVDGTKLLVHHPTHTMGATSRENPTIERWKHEVAFHEEMSEQYYWCLGQCGRKAPAFWKELLGHATSRLLDADEALRFGLIDHVIPMTRQIEPFTPV